MDASARRGWLSQHDRLLAIDTDIVGGFHIERFSAREAISEDFRLTIDGVAPSGRFNLKPLIGTPASVRLITADGSTRYWQGFITQAVEQGSAGYRLTVQSWLAFLALRRNSTIFQGRDLRGVLEQVFGDHPQARWRMQVFDMPDIGVICTQYRETDADFIARLLGDVGLAYRFEHESDGPVMVIFDRHARFAGSPETVRFARIDATEHTDAITTLEENRQITARRVVASRWRPDFVKSVSGAAEDMPVEGQPHLPMLDHFDADRAGRFHTSHHAEAHAALRLHALRLPAHRYIGAGAVRTLEVGRHYRISGHPTLDDQPWIPLVIEHEASNHIDATASPAEYRQRFLAVPATTAIVPQHRDRPTAGGVQIATVVGEDHTRLASTRDHQVRVLFPWQSPSAPGIWVRVTEDAAGANHGHSFTPRIGTEVVIGYAHGDIDLPILLGQLYNGQHAPPFAAGIDASANHPGTLSGIQTQTADGKPGSRWVLDDAPGQLSHTLANSVANTRFSLGYLVDTPAAHRGAYRGEGFELVTGGWTVIRAGGGLLASALARAEAMSTQMDVEDALKQIRAATATAQRMNTALVEMKAAPLCGNTAQIDLYHSVDPSQHGCYPKEVAGQHATQPTATARHGGAPVERFTRPHILLEAPGNIILTTPNSAVAYADSHLHATSQHDTHLAAGHTFAAVTGGDLSLFTAAGGFKAIAQHGPITVQAHTEAMRILADDSVVVTSSTERIDILANETIVLRAGEATVTLQGENITFACPGQFTVRATQAPFGEPQGDAPLLHLPTGLTQPAWSTTRVSSE